MAVFGEIVAGPVLTGLAAIIVAHNAADKPVDPCKPPMIRLESANLAALPGPNSPACKALRAAETENKKERLKKD